MAQYPGFGFDLAGGADFTRNDDNVGSMTSKAVNTGAIPVEDASEGRALRYGLAAAGCWATVATAFKLSLAYLSPLLLVCWASWVSLAILAAIIVWQGRLSEFARFLRTHWRASLLLGACNPALYYWVLFSAYDLLPAQQAQSINFSWGVTLALLSVPVLGHRLSLVELAACLLSYLGVVVIATRGDLLSLQFDSTLGVSLALFSTLLWSGYWLINTRIAGAPAIKLFAAFLCGCPLLLAVTLLVEPLLLPPWQGVAGAAYVGCFEMGVTFFFWQTAMQSTRHTVRISNLIFLAPPVSLLLIYLILGELIHPATLVGLALVVAGVVGQQYLHRRSVSH